LHRAFVRSVFGFLVATLFASQSIADDSEVVQLKCEHIHTNPFSAPPEGKPIVMYFDLDNKSKSARMGFQDSPSKIDLTTLFWNKNFIGLVEGSSKLIPSISSYLFDRKAGRLLSSNSSVMAMDVKGRRNAHIIASANGNTGDMLMSCSRSSGF